MTNWSRLQKLVAIAIGGAGGISIYLYTVKRENDFVIDSWTTNNVWIPNKVKWDSKWNIDWDRRDPKSIVKELHNNATDYEVHEYNEKLRQAKPKAVRHLILIRNGQSYGLTDYQSHLTDIGRTQAILTGQRLKLLDIKWDKLIQSTATVAQETAKIISTELTINLPIDTCSLIDEGVPIMPEPAIEYTEPFRIFPDEVRIEAAFRKYFHRADAKQNQDSVMMIVCDGNVIRYFVCRAMQFPSEAWLRFSLNHASITMLSILPSGRVSLSSLGDSGHLPPKFVTDDCLK